MPCVDLLGLARHYRALAEQRPEDGHFWTARSLYFGRLATHPAGGPGPSARRRAAPPPERTGNTSG